MSFEITSNEMMPFAVNKPAPRLVQIGIVAIDKKTGKPSSGALYSAGAKVYKSEAMARAAVRYKGEVRAAEYEFVPAFIEGPA